MRVVNGAQSPDVDAQGGQATFVLQTMLSSSNSNSSSRANNTGAPDIGRAAYVTPAMGSVYLNGLQCTRLPLMTAEDGSQPQDCAATHWDLDSTRMFMLPPGWNASASYSSFTYANNGSTYFHTGNGSSNDSSSSNLTNDVLAALQWLSCTSHYCCGLQVVPPGSEQTPPASAPAVGALDGPGERPNPAAASTYAKVGGGIAGLSQLLLLQECLAAYPCPDAALTVLDNNLPGCRTPTPLLAATAAYKQLQHHWMGLRPNPAAVWAHKLISCQQDRKTICNSMTPEVVRSTPRPLLQWLPAWLGWLSSALQPSCCMHTSVGRDSDNSSGYGYSSSCSPRIPQYLIWPQQR